ncbi:hypothetical protein OO009_03355 [Flavobacteriaceae bacterium KMM 6897]|nr:hypothetical protein [Flavobacteriaceae bacterium KMM 6897]MEB8346155.1 hypothetical protein [Flavobacteriaceae bacterium KMM 6898]
MKELLSITMTFIFLFQGISLDMDLCKQIEQISHFISHYQDHKDFDGDSFLEYVGEEYFSDGHEEEEHHNDANQNQSPSHSHHQCCNPLVFIKPTNVVALNFLSFEEKRQVSSYTAQFNSRFLESLFQPPRV